MTVLSVLSDLLTTADRALVGRRGGLLGGLLGAHSFGGSGTYYAPGPQNQPIALSNDEDGEPRLVTYADSVATYPTIFAVWSKLVQHLATTELGVFRQLSDGRLERAHGTDLERLLREPMPGKGLVDTLQWAFNPYFVEGNGLMAKFRGDGEDRPPTNLLPLDWRFMSALARPGAPVEHWIAYQLGEPRELTPRDVVHIAWQSPNGSSIGTSALQPLGTTIRLDDSAERYQIASFDNGSRPAGALVAPSDARIPEDERAEMREKLEKRHKGVDNAFRIAFLTGGLEWRPFSFSAVEAELVDTRKATKSAACVAYGVSRSTIDGEGSVEEVMRGFHRSLVPHTRLLENVLQRQLIDPEPEWREERLCVRLDLSDLMRGTYREEMETAVHGYTNGVLSERESRAHVGLPPSGNTDDEKPLVPHAQLDPSRRDGRTLPPSDDTDPSRLTRPTRAI